MSIPRRGPHKELSSTPEFYYPSLTCAATMESLGVRKVVVQAEGLIFLIFLFFLPLVTRDNYCGIDQASRVLEQINCAVASVGGAQPLMEAVAGSSCCNVA